MILLGATGRSTYLLALNWDLRTTSLILVGALLLCALVIALTARWRKRLNDEQLSASDQLAEFRSLYLQGAISKEEFERLRAVLGGEMRREMHVPEKPSTAGSQAVRPEEPTPIPQAEEKPPAPQPHPEGVQTDDRGPRPGEKNPTGDATG
jgi:hypothetical protein